MSESPPSGSVPAEVPEEFAAAYRAAYEQAMAEQSVPGPGNHARRDRRRDDEEDGLPERTRALRIGTHRERVRVEETPVDDRPTTPFERLRDSGWLVPVLLLALALVLVLGAYAVGRVFAGHVHGPKGRAATGVVMREGGKPEQQPVSEQKPAQGAWSGTVTPIQGLRASTGCTMPPGVDAAGRRVTYDASRLVDGAADTAWRCDGSAVGQKITLDLGADVPVGAVGLIPGYAKTDEKDGTDRYAENDRVTKVRWTIGGTSVVQSFGADPKDRSLRMLRVPRSATGRVTLEILSVAKGARDTTAISEVQVSRAG